MIKVGCTGFPVGRASYFRELPAVEVRSSLVKLPRLATVGNWKREAPEDFAYSLYVWHPVTHLGAPGASPTDLRAGRGGHFRDSPVVDAAWEATEKIAAALDPRFLVFETPATFYPNADHLRDMYRFFRGRRRDGRVFVWDPRGAWEQKLLAKVCKDLNLVLAVDPLGRREAPPASVHYFRLTGAGPDRKPSRGHRYHEADLRLVLDRCKTVPSYVFFATTDGWLDSRRLRDLADPVKQYLRGRA